MAVLDNPLGRESKKLYMYKIKLPALIIGLIE